MLVYTRLIWLLNYVVQSLSSETEHIVTVVCTKAHKWRRGMVPCWLVSCYSKVECMHCKQNYGRCCGGDLNALVGTRLCRRWNNRQTSGSARNYAKPLPKRFKWCGKFMAMTHWVDVLRKGKTVWRMMCVIVGHKQCELNAGLKRL